MCGEPILDSPIVIDDTALLALARAGHRWQEGRAGRARYRWLLPPDWVLADGMLGLQRNGIQLVCGGGDRAGRLTAVLGILRGCDDSPEILAARGAPAGARLFCFRSRNGPVAERVQQTDSRTTVTTVHAFKAGGEPHRFLIAAVGVGGGAETCGSLRTLGAALALADELDGMIDGRRLGGRLHG